MSSNNIFCLKNIQNNNTGSNSNCSINSNNTNDNDKTSQTKSKHNISHNNNNNNNNSNNGNTIVSNRISLDIISISDCNTTNTMSGIGNNMDDENGNVMHIAKSPAIQILSSCDPILNNSNNNRNNRNNGNLKMNVSNGNKSNDIETSEEIKKLMIQLLTVIYMNNWGKMLEKIDDSNNKNNNNEMNQSLLNKNKNKNNTNRFLQLLNVLCEFANDKCPEIKTMSCKLLINMLDNLLIIENKWNFFQCHCDLVIDYSLYLFESYIKGLRHQRAKLRLISFQSLSKIVLFNLKYKNKFPDWLKLGTNYGKNINLLRFDRMGYIRTQLIVSCVEWLATLYK